ncbi:MAG: hypothetical protein F2534_12865 [Actinobacteria bacterium]|nr:hypothetical protein [Actinomycetota bacterium]
MAARSTFTRTSGSVITSAWANSLRDHIVPYSGAADGTTDGMLSVNTADDTLRIGNGTTTVIGANYGAWNTWTADVRQNGIASCTETECEWRRVGRDIVGGGSLTVGTITSAAGFAIEIDTFGLPVVSGARGGHLIGTFLYHDVGTTYYQGALLMNSSGTLSMRVNNVGGFVGVNPSFAVAVNDEIQVSFSYRAASTT